MKKIILSLCIAFAIAKLQAQNVGINTTTPTRPLTVFANTFGMVQTNGVDTMGTWISPSGTPLPYAWVGTLTNVPLRMSSGRDNNHISIMNNGKVGIGNGVQTPSSPALLEVDGQIKINGGTPGTGKVLTTDATGLASWETPSGGFSLPYTATQNSSSSLFEVTNTANAGIGINGISNSITGTGVIGSATGYGVGVFGYSETVGSLGVKGEAVHGTGVFGHTTDGQAGIVGSSNGTGFGGFFSAFTIALKTGGGNVEFDGFTKLGNDATTPKIKMKKLTGTTTSADNTFFFAPHGVDASKILSISTLVTDGGYQYLPHSPDAGAIYTVNVDGANIAIGVKTGPMALVNPGLSTNVMGKPFKILITYEE